MDEELYGTDLKLVVETRPEYMGLGADLLVNKKGDLQTASGRENLGQAILHRLLTRKGELGDIGHPDYGSRLHELIGEPNNERTRELVRLYAKECISQEPRVQDIKSLTVSVQKGNQHVVFLDVTVLPIKSNVPMNVVFPFYLEVA
ncbi:MAG: GPW/gp25 family protein [Candidatus Methanoperedens sp.]|nr:GPW/gp25 family protein [Candidatus Methanoperedens sp.]MCE8429248.1 GPW/gp25 family protein [Candidatus Methanoperedens sp.]